MLINNINIEKYNARVLDIDIQNSSINNIPEWIEQSLLPNFRKSKVKLNIITVNLLMDSKDKHSNYLDRSNLLSLMIKPFGLFFEDRNLKFRAVLAEQQFVKGTKGIKGTLQLHLYAYCFEGEKVEILDKITSKSINAHGNLKTPCIVEINPSIDMIDLKLEGLADDPIIIKNLKKNRTVIVNGIDNLVTCEGINKFQDTDMWEFPRLKSGVNNIKISRNECNIKIKYNPRWI